MPTNSSTFIAATAFKFTTGTFVTVSKFLVVRTTIEKDNQRRKFPRDKEALLRQLHLDSSNLRRGTKIKKTFRQRKGYANASSKSSASIQAE
jgi:hypothetical protein